MILSSAEREEERIKRVRAQMKEQERARLMNPNADSTLEKFWVVHVWAPYRDTFTHGEWLFAGFRPRKHRRKPQTMGKFFAKVRRKLGLDKNLHVMMMDLAMMRARVHEKDQSWRHRPPQYQAPKTKIEPREATPYATERFKQKATVRAPRFQKKLTKFIAIGRNSWDRTEGYLFLGPIDADTLSLAQKEVARKFPVYNDLILIKTSDLSVSLRNMMHSGKRIRAGVTRLSWPERPPLLEDVWAKLGKRMTKQGAALDSVGSYIYNAVHTYWLSQERPWITIGWLRKAIAKLTPKSIPLSSGDAPCDAPSEKAKPKKKVLKREKVVTKKRTKPSDARRRSSSSNKAPKRVSSSRKKVVRRVAAPRKKKSSTVRSSSRRSSSPTTPKRKR